MYLEGLWSYYMQLYAEWAPAQQRTFHFFTSQSLYLPDIASCWILNCRLMVGFSSGFDVPACRLTLPFRLGSFWGFIFPTSHDSNFKEQKMQQWNSNALKKSPIPMTAFNVSLFLSILPFILARHRIKEQIPQNFCSPPLSMRLPKSLLWMWYFHYLC